MKTPAKPPAILWVSTADGRFFHVHHHRALRALSVQGRDRAAEKARVDRPVIVLNADFEIIGETKFPGKKYFYKMSFVGREGLYISENNLENPQFDENKLVFTRFKIKNVP